MEVIFEQHHTNSQIKLNNFELYVKRQALTRFIARYELFKQIISIKGSIVECGVHHGGGLMAWAKLSSGLEPMALHRKIIGFDTFDGFIDIHDNDIGVTDNQSLQKGGFSAGVSSYDYITQSVKEYDENRFLNQFEKVELIKGDATITIPEFISANQHLIISLLFLDFDLYQPTKAALKNFLPRIPKGGIIAFDEINNSAWPGETVALIEEFGGLNKLNIQKFPFDPNIAYIVL